MHHQVCDNRLLLQKLLAALRFSSVKTAKPIFSMILNAYYRKVFKLHQRWRDTADETLISSPHCMICTKRASCARNHSPKTWKPSSMQVKVVPMGAGVSQVAQAALMWQINQGLTDLSSTTRQSSHQDLQLLNHFPTGAGIDWNCGE